MNDLYSLLMCPGCGAKVEFNKTVCLCRRCQKSYQVIDGVVIFIENDILDEHHKSQVNFFSEEQITGNHVFELQHWQSSYLDRFFKNIQIHQNMVVIDCGTGSGYMAIELAKQGCKVLAIDVTLRSLIRLSKISQEIGLDKNILCICCIAEKLPITTASTDVFISNAVLEHIEDELGAINEMGRVMKSNSRIMLTVPLAYKYLNPIFILANWIHDLRIGHLRRYSHKSISNKFSKINFCVFKTYYTGHTAKVFKTGINFIFKFFDEDSIERKDAIKDNQRYMASNIITFLKNKF